jgi:hypothetical protein
VWIDKNRSFHAYVIRCLVFLENKAVITIKPYKNFLEKHNFQFVAGVTN